MRTTLMDTPTDIKKALYSYVAERRLNKIVALAGENKRVLSYLTAITYTPDPLIAWRAIEAMGLAARRIADDDPEYVRIHLRRLSWLLNDESGGIGWHAPELMGEIVYNCPPLLASFVPMILSILDMEAKDVVRFRSGALWAAGRLAQVFPSKTMVLALPWIFPCLILDNPQVRGMALWCLHQKAYKECSRIVADVRTAGCTSSTDGQLGNPEHIYKKLVKDDRSFELYQDGHLVQYKVSAWARQGTITLP